MAFLPKKMWGKSKWRNRKDKQAAGERFRFFWE